MKKMKKSKQMKKVGGKMPNLADFRKTVPPGGLLNPGLRQGLGKRIPKM